MTRNGLCKFVSRLPGDEYDCPWDLKDTETEVYQLMKQANQRPGSAFKPAGSYEQHGSSSSPAAAGPSHSHHDQEKLSMRAKSHPSKDGQHQARQQPRMKRMSSGGMTSAVLVEGEWRLVLLMLCAYVSLPTAIRSAGRDPLFNDFLYLHFMEILICYQGLTCRLSACFSIMTRLVQSQFNFPLWSQPLSYLRMHSSYRVSYQRVPISSDRLEFKCHYLSVAATSRSVITRHMSRSVITHHCFPLWNQFFIGLSGKQSPDLLSSHPRHPVLNLLPK